MKIILQDVVKMMERGQVTLPSAMRKRANLTPQSLLVIEMNQDNSINIKSFSQKDSSLHEFLIKMKNDKTDYWSDTDEVQRKQNKKDSLLRIKNLWK